MKLLQLNAWSIRLAARIEDMVAKEKPDVITLQEVFESVSNLGFFPTLTEFANDLNLQHQYFSPVYGFQFIGANTQFGNAVLTHLSFDDTSTQFTNLRYKDNFSFDKDDYNIRNFQHAVMRDKNDDIVHIINHHGYHISGHKRGDNATLKACRQIIEYALKLEGPVIIAGDFNLEPDSESIGIIDQHFRNLTKEYGLTTTRTDLTHKTEPCDYIFVNDKIDVINFYPSEVVASDHKGLVLDFELKS